MGCATARSYSHRPTFQYDNIGTWLMTSRNAFNAFAAARDEGLHPRLRESFDRAAARPFSELAVRGDGMLQAGPDPASTAPLNATIPAEEADAPLAIRPIRSRLSRG
jgi:hypothetical protein